MDIKGICAKAKIDERKLFEDAYVWAYGRYHNGSAEAFLVHYHQQGFVPVFVKNYVNEALLPSIYDYD